MEEMELKNTVEDHEKRIETLETIVGGMQENFTALSNDVVRVSNDVMKVQTGQAELAKGQKDIEVTMVKEGQANREVIAETKQIANRLLDHVLDKDDKETDTESKLEELKAQADAKLKELQAQNEVELKKQKAENSKEIWLKVLGAGGALSIVVSLVYNIFV